MDCAEDRERLAAVLRPLPSVLVALSGGVDSALVLALAKEVVPRVVAATAISPAYATADQAAAAELCATLGVEHRTVPTRETTDPRYSVNLPTRCFHCKLELYEQFDALARQLDLHVVLDGTHVGDLADFRPGMAAAEGWNVRSPLREAGLDKPAIRELARQLGLAVWDRPASPCLASRFPYGEVITIEKLAMVEQAEAWLRTQGFTTLRVRHHGSVARIEVPPEDMTAVLHLSASVVAALRKIGYAYVCLDLAGFRSGSLNEVLPSVPIHPPAPPPKQA